jgi:hypothetical protein
MQSTVTAMESSYQGTEPCDAAGIPVR